MHEMNVYLSESRGTASKPNTQQRETDSHLFEHTPSQIICVEQLVIIYLHQARADDVEQPQW